MTVQWEEILYSYIGNHGLVFLFCFMLIPPRNFSVCNNLLLVDVSAEKVKMKISVDVCINGTVLYVS